MVLKARVLVALATLLALGLAGVQLGHAPFWLDEFLTWQWARLPFGKIWPWAERFYHPPLYFWFMHGWLRVSPSPDEIWMRLPSVLFFGLTVPVVYLVGRDLAGSSRAGVYAAFLAATAPFLLHYGQEARPYAMLTFFAACGFAAVARIMRRWRDEARPQFMWGPLLRPPRPRFMRGSLLLHVGGAPAPPTPPGGPPRPRLIGAGLVDACGRLARGHWRESGRALRDDGAWAVYIVSSVAVMGLHNTAGIYPVVTGLILLCAVWASPSFRGVRFAGLCIAMAAVALLYSPQIPHLLSSVGRISLPYVEVPDAEQVLRVFRRVYGGGSGVSLTLLTILVATAAVAWARNGRWEWTAFALLGWLLAPALLIAFSFWKPILQPKILIWTLVPFFAAGGAGLALVPWRLVCAGALAALLVFHLQGVAREWRSVAQDWRSVSRIIAREASPDAAVLVCFVWNHHVFSHYWEKEGRSGPRLHLIDILGGRQRVFEAPPAGGGDTQAGTVRWFEQYPQVDPTKLFARYPQVWLIWVRGCDGRFDFLTTALEEQGRLVRESREEGVRIRWYERSE